MRSLHLLILGFVLQLPAPAVAQAVKRADLVGTWIGTMVDGGHDKGYESLRDSAGKVVKRSKVPVQYRLVLQDDGTWEQTTANAAELDLGADYHGWLENGTSKTGMRWSMDEATGVLWGYCTQVNGAELNLYLAPGDPKQKCTREFLTAQRQIWSFRRVDPSKP